MVNNMGLLDDEPKPLWTPPKQKRFNKQTALSQEKRDYDLNNHDRDENTEDFSDSPRVN
jgi:hypothetical protein